MNRLATILLALAVACGGDHATAPQPKGTLVVRLSAQTCSGSDAVDIFIDGASQGRQTMNAGDARSFTVVAGNHTIGANAQTSGINWTPVVIFVSENSTFTQILNC